MKIKKLSLKEKEVDNQKNNKFELYLILHQGHRNLFQSGWAKPRIILLVTKSWWADVPFQYSSSKKAQS